MINARLLAVSILALCLACPAWAQKAPPVKAKAPTAKAIRAPAQPSAPGQLLETIRKRGALHLGIAPSIPWAMRDPTGAWQGYEIDVARQLASDLGVELKLVRVRFSHFTDALIDGTVDIVSAGYSITPQRALVVDFSLPYAQSPMELVARADLAGRDLDRSDITIGVRAGGAPESVARSRFPRASIVTFAGQRALHEALRSGKVDAALAYSPRTTFAVANAQGALAVMTAVSLPSSVEGFAVRKGEQGLLNYLNAWIAYWKADGWLDERRHYWFESLDWTPRFQREGAPN